MNLTLKRLEYLHDGIFGHILDDNGNKLFSTLEHAYDSGNGTGSYVPKIPNGSYTCVRGRHQLEHSPSPFTTFEITGVPNHTKILLHPGDYNKDSDGCVLLGLDDIENNGQHMLISSRVAFQEFMELQANVNEFVLTVTG